MAKDELTKKAEEAIHVMAETAGRLNVFGATSMEYWKLKTAMEGETEG